MGDVVVVCAGEEPPDTWQASIFIAGPMYRDPAIASWRPGVVELLREGWQQDGTLAVFVPEARDRHHPDPGYASQVWEERWMAVVDVLLFWVPRDMQRLPGLNTNLEFGRNESSGRVVLGLPPEAVSVHYLRRAAQTHGAPVHDTVRATATAALELIGAGSSRTGALRDIPLLVWRTPACQAWIHGLDGVLVSARVLWTWSPGPRFTLLMWAVRVTTRRRDDCREDVVLAHPGSREVLVVDVAGPVDGAPPLS
jgi:hypothetical protein